MSLHCLVRSLAGLGFVLASCGSDTSDSSNENSNGQTATGVLTPPAGTSAASPAGATGTTGATGNGVNAGSTTATQTAAGAAGTSSAATTATNPAAGAANAGAPGSAATTGAAPGADPSMQFGTDQGDYFVSGTWHGYVWTAANGMGSSIAPMDFKMQTTGMPRCVMGNVAATDDYSGTASLGFDLAEDRTGAGSLMAVAPTKSGVMIDVTNNGGSELRVQVQGVDGSTTWCAPIVGSGGFIPWTSFNSMCWDGSGTGYNNEPIAKLSVLVPGKMADAVAFDFCVNSLAEADGAAMDGAMDGMMSTAAGSGAGQAGAGGQGGTSTGTTPPPVQGNCDGYVTGYWDCCKPHCGWKDKVPGANPLAACSMSDQSLGGDYDARSACDGGNAYQCHNLVPWAVNDNLAYGYSAVAASTGSDICGKCYQLQFTGSSHNSSPDPGSTALAGKTMIIQAVNIGSDVAGGQFDVLIPGRGVGMFNACSAQWGVSNAELGETYGGFLLACQKQGDRNDHAAMKACVMQSCMNVFEAHGLTELAAGCKWFIDWFQVADNPAIKYEQVACPAELSGKGIQRDSQPSNACLR